MHHESATHSGSSLLVRNMLCALLFLLLQGTLLPVLFPEWMVPNLLIGQVVFLAFYSQSVLILTTIFLLGLQLDLFTGPQLGPWSAAFTVVFLLVWLSSARVFAESPLVRVVSVAIASFVASFTYLLVRESTAWPVENSFLWQEAAQSVAFESVINGLYAPLVFWFMGSVVVAARRQRGEGSSFLGARSRSGRWMRA